MRVTLQPNDENRIARARRIWDESRPVLHTQGTAYLRHRAIPEAMWAAAALRFHPRMTSVDDRQRRPALIAAITDANGALQGVQVTLLSAHGVAKAPVATPRRVIGKLMGGVVRLGEGADECTIGEGVETMMSAASALGLPALAALTADNLSGFEPGAHIRRLVVAVDNDAAGHAAYRRLKARLAIDVEMAVPPNGAEDWNAAALQNSGALPSSRS